ncbi:MAG: hypothetical protein HQ536_03425 [Parcubacteria group bacterium]|nr:hypothetical protein [Parcubacteria group bacterium]
MSTKKTIFFILYFFVFLFLIWQTIFWVGEYREYKEYKSVVEKIGQETSFKQWVVDYSMPSMPVIGEAWQYKKYKKYVAVSASVGNTVILWDDWKNEVKKNERTAEEVMEIIKEELEFNENDIFAGDTPEETWELFIEALSDGDVELASKYFIREKQAENLEWFQKVQEGEFLEEMVGDLTVSGLDLVSGGDYMSDFVVGQDEEIVRAYVRIIKNSNNKWKIESI